MEKQRERVFATLKEIREELTSEMSPEHQQLFEVYTVLGYHLLDPLNPSFSLEEELSRAWALLGRSHPIAS